MSAAATTSVLLAGVGGQGILLASKITALAAREAGWLVKTNEVHGMSQRGGSVIAQIRYGSEVYSPLIAAGEARVLGSLERIEGLRYAHFLSPEGLAVVNSQIIVPVTVSMGSARYPADSEELLRRTFPRLIYLDAGKVALQLGNIKAANVVLLGALSSGLDLPLPAWEAAITAAVPARFRDLNLRAFSAGRERAESSALL